MSTRHKFPPMKKFPGMFLVLHALEAIPRSMLADGGTIYCFVGPDRVTRANALVKVAVKLDIPYNIYEGMSTKEPEMREHFVVLYSMYNHKTGMHDFGDMKVAAI